ncbi:MAG TPA: gas vesicle protein GvpG [Longimicrobiales bacterium]|nr:gas vesicle protein GvpG [Longimicrobiales bacterium]
MGLLKHLLFWPVTGPTFLARFSLEKVEGAVRTELTDDSAVKRDLMELQMELELGDIDDDEYVAREAALMHRLREVRDWRERFGMATAGGLVRVAVDAGEDEAGAAEADEESGPQVAGPDQAEIDIDFGFDDE